MTDPTNTFSAHQTHDKRAAFVGDQVLQYAGNVGLNIESEGFETVVGDMIADMLHFYIARTGKDPKEALGAVASGIVHFTAQSQVPVENYGIDIGPEVGVSIAVAFDDQQWTLERGANIETAAPRL